MYTLTDNCYILSVANLPSLILKKNTTGAHQFGITKKKVIFKRKVSNIYISIFEYNFYIAISIKTFGMLFERKKTLE